MLACTEMITMCLQSAKRDYLRTEQEQQLQHNHGLSIFHDVSTSFTNSVIYPVLFAQSLNDIVWRLGSQLVRRLGFSENTSLYNDLHAECICCININININT